MAVKIKRFHGSNKIKWMQQVTKKLMLLEKWVNICRFLCQLLYQAKTFLYFYQHNKLVAFHKGNV